MTASTVLLNGTEHYVTSNGIRTFVGPVRHRATRRVAKARALLARFTNHSKESVVTEDKTAVIPSVQESDPNATTVETPALGRQIGKMLEGLKLPTFHVNPPKPQGYKGTQRQGRLAELKEAITDRVYDSAWHEAVQNTCKTVGYVAMTTTSVVVFAKALVWVVLL